MSPDRADRLDETIEPIAAAAFPAAVVEPSGPWLLRWAGGFTGRANAVAVLGASPPTADLPTLIDAAEAFYARHDAPVAFQVPDTARTAPLAAALLERGYTIGEDVCVEVADVAPLLAIEPTVAVTVSTAPSPAWIDTWWAAAGRPDRVRPHGEALLARLPAPVGFASHLREDDGALLGTGITVVDPSGWMGVFAMATQTDQRGRGIARSVLAALARFGVAHGATRAYLQVSASNATARSVYHRAGFAPAYVYRYFSR